MTDIQLRIAERAFFLAQEYAKLPRATSGESTGTTLRRELLIRYMDSLETEALMYTDFGRECLAWDIRKLRTG